MASAYPAALDTLTNPASTDRMNVVGHAAQHADANNAIEAIEATLGTNPQGAYASVKERLDASGGITFIPLADTGDGSVSTTPEAVSVTAAFVTAAVKDIAFVVPVAIVITSDGDTATVTAQLVNDEAAVVASKSITSPVTILMPEPWTATLAGVFEDAPADTYTVRIMASAAGATATRTSIGGFVQH